MNILKYILFLSICLTACNNDEALPFLEFDELNYGAYPRLIDGINSQYGLAFSKDDVPGSAINFTVEFFDENQGMNVSSYSWEVNHSDGSNGQLGSALGGGALSSAGLPTATIDFTFEEVLAALNKTVDDVSVGESFTFEATLTKTDGSVFTSQNSSGSIQNTAGTIRGLFQIIVEVI